MTVATENAYAERSWTGVETTFSAGFAALDVAHVVVRFRDADDEVVPLTAGVHVTITKAGPVNQAGAITVTPIALPPAPGTLLIERNTPATQATDFADLGAFTANIHTRLHDAAALRDAERKRDIARAALGDAAALASGIVNDSAAPGATVADALASVVTGPGGSVDGFFAAFDGSGSRLKSTFVQVTANGFQIKTTTPLLEWENSGGTSNYYAGMNQANGSKWELGGGGVPSATQPHITVGGLGAGPGGGAGYGVHFLDRHDEVDGLFGFLSRASDGANNDHIVSFVRSGGSESLFRHYHYGSPPIPIIAMVGGRGVLGAATAIQNGDALGVLGGRGWFSASGTPTESDDQAHIIFSATQAWTASARGARIGFLTTPNNSVTPAYAGYVENDGGIVWPPAVTGGSKGAGKANISEIYEANVRVLTTANIGTATAGNLAYYGDTRVISGSGEFTVSGSEMGIGRDAATTGILGLANGGALGARVRIKNLGATSAYNFNLPATAGSSNQVLRSQGGGSTSMDWATLAASLLSDGTTGSGNIVLANTPSLITPNLGVAAATSINKVAITAPASAATLTIANGVTLSAPSSATVSGTNTGDVAEASQAEMEAGSATTMVSPRRMKHAPGVAKAWGCINYSAGAPILLAGENVSSLTDQGTGQIRVNLTTAFSSANYAAVANTQAGATNTGHSTTVTNPFSNRFDIENYENDVAADAFLTFFSAFGDQ